MIITLLVLLAPLSLCQTNCTSIRGCVKCTTPLSCDICVQSYYLLPNSTCGACPFGCQKCQSNTTCQQCKSGYYFDSGDCYSCLSNCGNCSNPHSCNTCMNGYYLNGSICKSCVLNFKACVVCDTSQCFSCYDGYRVQEGRCQVVGNISKVEIIIIATVSSIVVLLVVFACSLAYYLKRSRRTAIHDTITRSQMALELDPSTEQQTVVNFM